MCCFVFLASVGVCPRTSHTLRKLQTHVSGRAHSPEARDLRRLNGAGDRPLGTETPGLSGNKVHLSARLHRSAWQTYPEEGEKKTQTGGGTLASSHIVKGRYESSWQSSYFRPPWARSLPSAAFERCAFPPLKPGHALEASTVLLVEKRNAAPRSLSQSRGGRNAAHHFSDFMLYDTPDSPRQNPEVKRINVFSAKGMNICTKWDRDYK